VHYKGKLEASVEAELIKLSDQLNKNPKPINLILEPHDVSRLSASVLEKIDKPLENPFPSFALYPPNSAKGAKAIQVEQLTLDNLKSVVHSPARESLVKSLLAGDSAVWVMIKSGDQAKDDAARKALLEGIAKAESKLVISDVVIPKSELDAAQKKGEVDLDDVLYSSIPLKISFKIIELDVNDPREKTFIKMLTKGLNPDEYRGRCLAAPIFGRGRCLGVTVGASITAESIYASCEQICGECSCTVKSQSPGYDIVLNADWQSHVDTSPVMIDKVIPDLTGTGDFIDPAKAPLASQDRVGSVATVRTDSSSILKWVGIGLAIIIALFISSMMILRRKNG